MHRLLNSALVATVLLVFSAVRPISAQTAGSSCAIGRPAATLLFPYFEIDLEDSKGANTLLSISNTSPTQRLANVVIWTTCGVPAAQFTLHLDPDAVLPINLRDVIVQGKIPRTAVSEGLVENCADPLIEADVLQARLNGQPDPVDGLCYADDTASTKTVVGSVTVDLVKTCSETLRTPADEGYFAADDSGIGASENVLWGDFFLIDDSADSAQGFEAVPIVADPERFGADTPDDPRFYGWPNDRLPIGSKLRARFFQGGGFDGGTEFIVWVKPYFQPPQPCDQACSFVNPGFYARVRDEGGEEKHSGLVYADGTPFKIKIGSTDPPRYYGEDELTQFRFGTIDFDLANYCGQCSPPTAITMGVVMPVYSADGRFSAGLNAVRLEETCE